MNRRLNVCIAALGLGWAASFASAQATTNPAEVTKIPVTTMQSGAITPEQKTEIDTYVTTEIGLLTTATTPTARASAKGLIIAAAPGTSGGFSPQYLDAYATSIDSQITALLKTKLPLSIRLNLGVIAATVARNTQSWHLAPSADALMHDEAEAVALWGARTAKFVLPNQINVQAAGSKNSLQPTIVDTGLKFPGPVLVEAYDALVLSPLAIGPANQKNFGPAMKAVIPSVQALLNKRIQTYGPSIPKEPVADAQGTTFLTYSWVFAQQTPAQQKETSKILRDLLAKASELYTAPNAELLDLIKKVASGVAVISNDPNVTKAAGPMKNLNQTVPAPQVKADVDALVSAIDATAIMQTPAVQGGSTSRPSSGSASPASDLAVIK